MATIINNPQPIETTPRSNNGFLIGVILLFILALLFIFYGLPFLRSSVGYSMPQINIPDHINFNIQPK